jgi:gliding motility-associated-like protein
MKIKLIHQMNFLKIVFCIIFIFQVVLYGTSQVPNLTWVKSTNTNNFSIANSIEVDNQGNVFSVGQFRSTTDFDFGIGTFNLTPNGAEDVFVQKMDSNGNLLWAFQIGGEGSPLGYDDDNISDIEIDNFGNIIVIGQFGGICDFDPSINDFFISSLGNSDVFIAKYSNNGEFIWAKSIGGINIDSGTSITCDINDNIIATGQFYGTVDLDPSINSYFISSFGNSLDIFTLKLNSNGDFVWASSTGGFSSDLAYSTIDSNNDILQTGIFAGNVDFDPTNSIYNLSMNNTYYSIFVRKLDLNGEFIWAKGISCSVGSCESTSITSDSDNNIIITGYFQGTCDFDPSLDNYLLTSNGGVDIFILKLNANGDFIWAKSFGGSSTEYGVSIINDAFNNIYINGIVTSELNTIDFDPENNSFYLNENSGTFFLNLDQNGNFNWVCSPQSSQSGNNILLCETNPHSGAGVNGGFSIAENNNQFYLCGAYMNTVDFDPSTASYNLTSTVPNVNKYFIQKLNFCNQENTNIFESICQSYTWPINNLTYTSSGVYSDTMINMFGCDSIITLNLTILSPTTSSISPVVCNSYSSPSGNIYYQTGTYIDTIQNVIGCDSIITINLTVVGTLNVNAGPNLNVCLGNSIVLTATGATNYVWSNGISNGVAFIPSLTDYYSVTGTDGNGCLGQDSVLITVNDLPSISFNFILPDCEGGLNGSINTEINGVDPITYQWSNGSVNQNLQIVSAGSYNLTVVDGNGCVASQNFQLPDGEGDCLLIPTGFTPNGDNQNDTWQIIGIENFAKNNVQVFNRWGQTVFESQGTPVNWSGKYKDEMLPIADYYFVVDLGNGQVFNGTVTLKY